MSKRAKKTMEAYNLLCEKPYRAKQLESLLGVSHRSTYRILHDLKALGLVVEISPCMYFIQRPPEIIEHNGRKYQLIPNQNPKP